MTSSKMFQSKIISILILITPIFSTTPTNSPTATESHVSPHRLLSIFSTTPTNSPTATESHVSPQPLFSPNWFFCCCSQSGERVEKIDLSTTATEKQVQQLEPAVEDPAYNPLINSVKPRRLMSSLPVCEEPEATEPMPTGALGNTEDSNVLRKRQGLSVKAG